MPSIQRYGLNNNLIRWVHRHNRMATLFRSSLPGPEGSLSSRSLPSYRSVLQPGSQGSQNAAAAFEPQMATPRIEEQTRATPAQVDYPAEQSSSKNVALSNKTPSSKSSWPQETPQAPDQDWARLQAIFRKHEGQAEATPANIEPSAEPTLHEPFHEDVQPESKSPEQPSPLTVFRKPQIQTETKSTNVSAATASQTASAPPSLLDFNNVNEQVKQETGHTIQHKPQRQVETTSATVPEQTLSQTESAAPDRHRESHEKEQPSLQQRIWHGLNSIFRKAQVPDEVNIARREDPTKPATESSELELSRLPSNTNEPALPGEYPSSQRSAVAFLSTKPVQRSAEKIEGELASPETKTQIESESFRSKAASSGSIAESEFNWTDPNNILPEEMPGLSDQAPITNPIRPPLHLQSVWNVQRVENPESNRQDLVTRPDPVVHTESTLANDPGPDGEQRKEASEPIVFGEEKGIADIDNIETSRPSFSDSSRTLAEILAPSRPRPPGSSVRPPNQTVQRTPENRNPAESPMVNTAIGELPADLWSLLGQQPPVGSDQPATQIRAPGNFTPATNSSDEKSASRQPVEEKSVNVAHLPETIQRQTESGDAVATSADQQQDQGAEKKKASQAEPDLNDLANKVYKEVRHRLATEWERNRLK